MTKRRMYVFHRHGNDDYTITVSECNSILTDIPPKIGAYVMMGYKVVSQSRLDVFSKHEPYIVTMRHSLIDYHVTIIVQ